MTIAVIGKQMKTITDKLDAIFKQKAALGLREGLIGVGGVEYRHEGVVAAKLFCKNQKYLLIPKSIDQ